MENRHEAGYRVVSAIPGRIRVQLAPQPSSAALVFALASRLDGLDGVRETRPSAAAHSVIVHYRADVRTLEEMQDAVSAAVDQVLAERLPVLSRAAQPRNGLTGGGSGSSRSLGSPASRGNGSRSGSPRTNQAEANRGAIDVPRRDGSGGKAQAAKAQLAGATLAIGLSLLEVPVPIVGLLVGLAALPTLREARKAARQRRIAMSQLDLVTVTTLAAMGDIRSAAEVLWVLGLADVMHDSGIRGVRRQMAQTAPTPDLPPAEQKKLAAMVQQAPVGSTRTERMVRRLADRLAAPLIGLAALTFAVTRNPLRAANVLKFADIDSGLRITTPEAVLNALAQAARQGIFIRGGRPLEALAGVDAVVIDSTLKGRTAGQVGAAVEAMLERGVTRLALRTGPLTGAAIRAAERLGAADALEVLARDDIGAAVRDLRRQGHRVAMLWDGGRAPDGAEAAAVCISFGRPGKVEQEEAEVILLDGGIALLGSAIDLARHTTHVLRQNVGLVMGPTTVGLAAAVAGMTSPILTTLVTNGAAALAGLNSLRPMGRARQEEEPVNPPAPLKAAAQAAG